MPRNAARTMTTEERARALVARDVIVSALNSERDIAFNYRKDGEEQSTARHGTPVEFRGHDSTASVIVETEKGPRTFNLRNMHRVHAQ